MLDSEIFERPDYPYGVIHHLESAHAILVPGGFGIAVPRHDSRGAVRSRTVRAVSRHLLRHADAVIEAARTWPG